MTGRRRGSVRDAIYSVLGDHGRPASVAEIAAGVEALLGEPVPSSSVRSYLRLADGGAIARTGRGQYSLPDYAHQEPEELPLRFQSGKCRLYQGDCLQWLRSQPPCSIHAVVTDPPYGMVEYSELQQRKLRTGQGGVWRIPPSFDGHTRSPVPRFTVLSPSELSELERFFARWATALFPVLVPGAHVVIASNPLLSYIVSGAVARAGFERRGEIVRLVMTMRGGDRPKNAHHEFSDLTVMPRSMWEPWLLFRKPLDGRVQDNLRRWKTGALRRVSDERPFGDVIASAPARPQERRLAPHPSLKPQSFLRPLVRAVLPLAEGIVLDPFAGSGSTLAAAEALGYESVGVESDAEYVAIAVEAIPSLTRLEVSLPQRR